MSTRDAVAFAVHDSGLYPYPEFVNLFVKLFNNSLNKAEADEIEQLISGGMNRKRLAKHLDNYLETSL